LALTANLLYAAHRLKLPPSRVDGAATLYHFFSLAPGRAHPRGLPQAIGRGAMKKLHLATVWLGGCSGCHISFLDLDEWLTDLAGHVELVYSPLADAKEFPPDVDVALVEGAVANTDHLRLIRQVRERARLLLCFGDCALTGNVASLRNPLGAPTELLERVYMSGADRRAPLPPDTGGVVPQLLEQVLPVHAVVAVDAYLPGCPPPAERIHAILEPLLASELSQLAEHEVGEVG